MKIILMSDTHEQHRKFLLPEADLLLHTGDFTFYGKPPAIVDFDEWLGGQLQVKEKIVIAGNHDLLFEDHPAEARKLLPSAIYLQDSGVEHNGWCIWGTPWQPWFLDWAFNIRSETVRGKKWALIPDNTDILMVHSPPYGIMDETVDGRKVGCRALLNRIEEIQPRLVVFGHIHRNYGLFNDRKRFPRTLFVNASNCDETYDPVNKPIILNLDRDSLQFVSVPGRMKEA